MYKKLFITLLIIGIFSCKEIDSQNFIIPVNSFASKTDNIQINALDDFFQKYKVVAEKKVYRYFISMHNNTITRLKEVKSLTTFLNKHKNYIGLSFLKNMTNQLKIPSVNEKQLYDNNYEFIKMIQSNEINDKFKKDIRKNMITFAQTGVTAITRGMLNRYVRLKNKNNNISYTFYSRKIASFLKQFDLTHTSNEVSFVRGCRQKYRMRFCAMYESSAILKDIGLDIVELTGNHNNDYGAKFNKRTINWYQKNKIKYFGGGKNLADARKILYVKKKKTTLALIGYNYANVVYNWPNGLASKDRAGANPYSRLQMKEDIQEAKRHADVVIVDIQFVETNSYKPGSNYDCYFPMKSPPQKKVFRMAIDFGADIVVGTQAHHPQIIEKYKNKLIFYGLGNIFFDQTKWEGTRQGMILVHLFYRGKHINTIVHPTYYDYDLAPYIPKKKKSKELLDIYYQRK